MLHVRVTAPSRVCDEVVAAVDADPTAANLVVIRGASLGGEGDLLLFEVARENATAVIAKLRAFGVVESGSISLSEPLTVLSRNAELAEAAAPGHPSDGVIWDQIEEQARTDARPSW